MKAPVYLRLCTNELMIVSEQWWDRFLRSQERLLRKKDLTLGPSTAVSSPVGDSSSTDYVRQIQEERREQRAV